MALPGGHTVCSTAGREAATSVWAEPVPLPGSLGEVLVVVTVALVVDLESGLPEAAGVVVVSQGGGLAVV